MFPNTIVTPLTWQRVARTVFAERRRSVAYRDRKLKHLTHGFWAKK